MWENGKIVEELFETVVPTLEVDAMEAGPEQKVFGGFRAIQVRSQGGDSGAAATGLPVYDENGKPVDGKAIVLFLNGDKYIGDMKAGKKHGNGMFIYADLTVYKGSWTDDVLHGMRHPLQQEKLPIEVRKLHDLNEENQTVVEALKKRAEEAIATR